ncbi:MAG: DUF4136 domain-containing protein [Ekhidna sp.]
MKKWMLLSLTSMLFCCTPKAISYINSEAKFNQFETFRVVSTRLDGKTESEKKSSFSNLKDEIINQMTLRSYIQSNIKPDLTLRYELSSTSRSSQNNNPNNTLNNALGFPPNFNSRTIHESILLLELYDDQKKLVWQGSYDLKNEKKEKKASIAIKNAVDIIFTSYPYMANSNKTHQELTYLKKKNND